MEDVTYILHIILNQLSMQSIASIIEDTDDQKDYGDMLNDLMRTQMTPLWRFLG